MHKSQYTKINISASLKNSQTISEPRKNLAMKRWLSKSMLSHLTSITSRKTDYSDAISTSWTKPMENQSCILTMPQRTHQPVCPHKSLQCCIKVESQNMQPQAEEISPTIFSPRKDFAMTLTLLVYAVTSYFNDINKGWLQRYNFIKLDKDNRKSISHCWQCYREATSLVCLTPQVPADMY